MLLLHLGTQDGGGENAWKDRIVSAFIRVSRVDTDCWELRFRSVVFSMYLFL